MSPFRQTLPGIYNPANQTKEELIANFVVRLQEFQKIFDVIKADKMKKPPQHFIIQGRRGSGKTTLLLRLYHEVNDNQELNQFLIPVIFDEEQYGIRTLYKLWEEIALYLDENHETLFYGFLDEMQVHMEAEDYEEKCYELLKNRLIEKGKKLVLFIDNFGDMLGKFKKKERQRLREVLIQCSEIRIVGASAVVLEFHYDYSEPFFEFFKVFHLGGLDQEETVRLLLQLGKTYKIDTVKDIIEHNPGRVETLRRLSGGVPRTIILLFEIFVDNEKGDSFHDLEIILDRVTPLYKHRMDGLPPQKQEIVDALGLNWDAMGVKEISKKTRIPGKSVSAQLNELEKNRIVTKIPTSTKNNFYQLSERFFNIWYLMRSGRKRERQKVLWLVKFLESWCSKDELIQRAKFHIEILKEGNVLERYAFYMTEALSSTEIPRDIQDEMIKTARDYFIQKDSTFINKLSASENELYAEAFIHLINGEYKNALNKFLRIEDKHPVVYLILGNLFESQFKNFEKAEEYYLKAVESNDWDVIYNLPFLWETTDFSDIKRANKYYRLFIKRGQINAMGRLAFLYFKVKKSKLKALALAQKVFESEQNADSAGLYALILLWNNEIGKAFQMFKRFIESDGVLNDKEASKILLMLLAKKQYHYLFKLFRENQFYIRDRFKPIYYALMVLMKDEFPDEQKKMGEELKQTVEEIVQQINKLAIDYA